MKRTIKLVFMKSDLIGSKFIRFMTWSKYSHVGILLPDGNVIEARYPEGVVMRPLDIAISHATEYEIVSIPVKSPKAAYDFAKSQLGKPYDIGGLCAFISHRDWQSDEKWFCSELAATCTLKAGTSIGREGASRTTPNDVYNYPGAVTIKSMKK